MQMAHENHGEIGKLRLHLTEADVCAPARIDKNFRLITDPEQIAGICTVPDETRCTRAQHLHR